MRLVALACALAGCDSGAVAPKRVARPPVAGTFVPAKLPALTDSVGVWSGREVLLWGGRSGEWEDSWSSHDQNDYPLPPLTSDGHRYDPATDTLTPMSASGAPAPREAPIGAWTGTALFVCTATCALYDPAMDRWTPTPAPPAALAPGGTATWTGTEVLVWAYPTALAYNPASTSWRRLSTQQAPLPDTHPMTAWTGSELVVLTSAPRSAAAYDPRADRWRPLRTPPEAMFIAPSAMQVVVDQQLYVLGAIDRDGINAVGLYRLDVASGVWHEEPLPQPVCDMEGRAVWTGTHIVAFGSRSSGCIIDPRTRLVQRLGDQDRSAPPEHAVWTGGRAVVWGGTLTMTPPRNEGMYRPARVNTLGGAVYVPAP